MMKTNFSNEPKSCNELKRQLTKILYDYNKKTPITYKPWQEIINELKNDIDKLGINPIELKVNFLKKIDKSQWNVLGIKIGGLADLKKKVKELFDNYSDAYLVKCLFEDYKDCAEHINFLTKKIDKNSEHINELRDILKNRHFLEPTKEFVYVENKKLSKLLESKNDTEILNRDKDVVENFRNKQFIKSRNTEQTSKITVNSNYSKTKFSRSLLKEEKCLLNKRISTYDAVNEDEYTPLKEKIYFK